VKGVNSITQASEDLRVQLQDIVSQPSFLAIITIPMKAPQFASNFNKLVQAIAQVCPLCTSWMLRCRPTPEGPSAAANTSDCCSCLLFTFDLEAVLPAACRRLTARDANAFAAGLIQQRDAAAQQQRRLGSGRRSHAVRHVRLFFASALGGHCGGCSAGFQANFCAVLCCCHGPCFTAFCCMMASAWAGFFPLCRMVFTIRFVIYAGAPAAQLLSTVIGSKGAIASITAGLPPPLNLFTEGVSFSRTPTFSRPCHGDL